MNGDVWKELEERLKQKAKTLEELKEDIEKLQSCAKNLASDITIDLRKIVGIWKRQWVRLEDVLEALKELKQNYFFVPKNRFVEFLSQWCRAFRIEVKPEKVDLEKIQKVLSRK